MMIKLIVSELEFDKVINVYVSIYPTGVQHKEVYINPDLVESVVIKEIGFYCDYPYYHKNWLGNNVVYYKATERLRSNFYELTMSSGVKYLTMEKLDFIEGFGEV